MTARGGSSQTGPGFVANNVCPLDGADRRGAERFADILAAPGGVTDPREIDTRASLLMKEGICLMQSGNDANAALVCFDRALDLRRRLPTEVPAYAYGLAACWLNRAEALTTLGPTRHSDALAAYDEALALLHTLPLGQDARFPRWLAIALQNCALVLVARNPLATADAAVSLAEAIEVLDHADAMDRADRKFLLAAIWMNLANIQVSEDRVASDLAAQESALRALALVNVQEREDAAAAAVGLKARRVLCRIAARRLSVREEGEPIMANVHDATDLADEGLALARDWERRGVDRFGNLASDLFRLRACLSAISAAVPAGIPQRTVGDQHEKSVKVHAVTIALAAMIAPHMQGNEPDPNAVHYTLPQDIQWKKGPITDSVMLQGDMSKPGIYIQLMRWHPNNMSRPHTHDAPRYVMVMSGTWWVGTGAKFDPNSTKPMPAGSYVVDQPNELHYDGAKDEECVLMIMGMGPTTTSAAGKFEVGPITK